MAAKEKLSQTMRIDLIPDAPSEAVAGKEKRIVVATPTRRHMRSMPGQQKSLTSEDSKYAELLQSLYDAAMITDSRGQIVDANLRANEFMLYSREEMNQLSIYDIVSGADENLVKTLTENLENERFTLIQAYCIRKDGTFFPAEIAVNKLSLGSVHLCFFVRDITLRRQAEEMLRTEHNAIQNSASGIAIVDVEGNIEFVNPAVAYMWGYDSADTITGTNVKDMFADRAAGEQLMANILGGQPSVMAEMLALRSDGQQVAVQVSASVNKNSDGEQVGIVFSFADISDRKRAEQAELEAERNRVMLESLGAACHHLGQPATVLLANLGIMQKRTDGMDDLVKELVVSSIEAAETLGEILHKLNTVNEYKTTRYLEQPEGSDSPENRILEI